MRKQVCSFGGIFYLAPMLCRFSLLFSCLLACLLADYRAVAQQPLGTLAGTVQDSVSRRPVAYATVVLLPTLSPAQAVATGTTNEQGGFTLANVPSGTFRLQVSFVGYASHRQAVLVTASRTTVPPILLAPTTQQLGEAVVVGTKPVVEVHPDRLVYHAAQDVSNSGGTAQDVLRKTPLLAVDGLGNVTLNGSGNFKVLVDNHPSPTLAQNLQHELC